MNLKDWLINNKEMSVFGYIFFIIVFVSGVVLTLYANSKDSSVATPAGFGALCLVSGSMVLLSALFSGEPKPSAIDVYNGKTTLQITYQDSVPVDTIVVWKNEFKPGIE